MAPRPGPSGSTVALTVVSALLTLFCYFAPAGLPALILAIVALVRAERDPQGSARLTKIGWIVLGVVCLLIVVLVVVLVGVGLYEFSDSLPKTPPDSV